MTSSTFDPTAPLGAVGEKSLLRRLEQRIPRAAGVVVGIGDDAAAVEIGPFALVTTDSLVEGVHFTREGAPPRLLGRKALTVNLSDVAAMGGVGRYATVSLCLPAGLEAGWVDALYDGILSRAAESGVVIVGGNVARGVDAIVVDVTLIGDAGRLLLRDGAQPGDRVVVTGALGAAAEGVALLAEGARLDEDGGLLTTGKWTDSSASAVLACLQAQLDPRPPFALARSIAERGIAHAGMDLSDGLSTDLAEMCRHAGLGAVIDAAALPVDPAVAVLERARGGDAAALALHGGEDYQLLLAVSPKELDDVSDLARVWGIPVTAVGEFVAGEPGVLLRDAAGDRPLPPGGHDHFRPAAR
ncbi:MAG: thiamine-phosphate kinase [Vicinamibacteria bacterium]